MAARLSSARMMVYNAAKAFDEGKDVAEISTLAAMSKVLATEAAHFACDEAVQIWGSMGYIKLSKVDRLFRDMRINQLSEGSSELQRLVVPRALKKDFSAYRWRHGLGTGGANAVSRKVSPEEGRVGQEG